MVKKGLISMMMVFAFILGSATVSFAEHHEKNKKHNMKKEAHKAHKKADGKKNEMAKKAEAKKAEVKKEVQEVQEEPMDAEEGMGEE